MEPGSPLSKAFRKEWISGGFGAEARDVFTCFTELNMFFCVSLIFVDNLDIPPSNSGKYGNL